MLTKNPNRVSVLTRYNEVKGNGQPELPCAFWNGDHYNIITSNSEATLEGAAVSGDRLAFRVEVTGDSNVLSCELRDADTGQILESSSSGFGFGDNDTFAYYFRANVNWKLYILSDEIDGLKEGLDETQRLLLTDYKNALKERVGLFKQLDNIEAAAEQNVLQDQFEEFVTTPLVS